MRKYVSEFTGTFFLIFTGCAAIIVDSLFPGTIGHIGISAVFGLTVMAVIYSVGNISGAHINPAVTLGFLLAGKIKLSDSVFYVLFQFAGAFAAGLVLFILFPDSITYGETLPSGGNLRALVFEIIMSFILMFVILNVSTGHKEKGIMAGGAVGVLLQWRHCSAGLSVVRQ